MQHDALSWQVMGNRFQYTKRSGDSIYLEKVLNDWLDNIDDEARKAFVDQIFSVLQSLGADTVKDMKDMSFKDIAEGIQQLRDLNKEQQGELSKVLKKLFRSVQPQPAKQVAGVSTRSWSRKTVFSRMSSRKWRTSA